MNLIIKENIDNVEEYNLLYDAVGWGAYDKKISKKALASNMYSISIYDEEKIVGYGRVIGDGIIFLYSSAIFLIALSFSAAYFKYASFNVL